MKPMLNTPRKSMVFAPLALCVSAGLAAPPAVLANVPADTALYAVIPDIGALLTDFSAMNTALAGKLPPEAAGIGMGLFFAQSVISQPGFNTNGSAAIMVNLPEGGMDGAEDPTFAIILPIADLEAFATGPFMAGQGTTFDGGAATLNMGGPDSLHMIDIGDFTVASDNKDAISGFEAGDFITSHVSALGASGERAVNSGDMVIVANLSQMGEMLDELMANAEQQVNFLAMMSGAGEQVTEGFGAFKSLMKTIQKDGSVGLLSLDTGGDGISLDLGVSFKEGSQSAAMFADASETGSLLNALPQDNFLLAYAMDSSAKGTGDIVKSLAGMFAKEDGADMGAMAVFANSTGTSGMIGASPAALGGAGLLSKQITYARAEDASKAVAAMRSSLNALDGESMMGQQYTTSYDAGSTEISGVKVDTYKITSKADTSGDGGAGSPMGMMMDPAMINSMLFGMAGGPNGYIAQVDNGYYSTVSKNSELLTAAINAGKTGEGLGGNEMIGRVASKLQEGRFGEAYLSLDQMYNTFAPFGQMMGMLDDFQPLEAMPPIGLSLVGRDGGMMGRLHIPMDVIGFLAELSETMESGGIDDGPQDPDF